MIHKYRKLVSALCYFLVGIIWYLIDEDAKRDPQIQFHAHQGTIFIIAAIIYGVLFTILMAIVTIIFSLIPVIGPIIISIISLLRFVPLIFAIIGVINALQENEKELPIIGEQARKLHF